ncbi:MAG TPA: hypothetical protein VFL17_05730 [Anaerolineae bacterium]|nr:hypothetical protein [Anaerolineae bacterium]
MSTPFDIFKEMLLQAAGGALARRGYTLQDDAIQIRSGLYRFARALEDGALALVDVQMLFYSGGGPSRFEVKVWRSDRPSDKTRLGVWLHGQAVETLADDLGWWEFVSGPELEESLRDAVSGLEQMWKEE